MARWHFPQGERDRPGRLGRHVSGRRRRPGRSAPLALLRHGSFGGPRSSGRASWGTSSSALKGLRLIISDAHEGLKGAIAKVFSEANWRRCRVHFLRNLLATVARAAQEAVAQPDHVPSDGPSRRGLGDAAQQVPPMPLTCSKTRPKTCSSQHTYPREHWRQLHSINTLERIHKEIERRTRVVGSSPTATPWCVWLQRCCRSRTTNGRWPIAATSAASPCVGSTAKSRR